MHAMSGSGDITKMGGLRKKLPWTHGVFFVCWLAICGVPLFSGFFSKDAILAGAFATHVYGDGPGLGGPGGRRACCCWRRWAPRSTCRASTSWCSRATRPRAADEHQAPHPRVARRSMVGAAGGAGGRRGAGRLHRPARAACSTTPSGTCSATGSSRCSGPSCEVSHNDRDRVHGRARRCWRRSASRLAYVVLRRRLPRAGAQVRRARSPASCALVQDKFRVDELYDAADHPPDQAPSRACLFRSSTAIIIDKILVEGSALVVDVFARIARTFQGGDGQRYMAVFAVGVALLVYFASQPTVPVTKLKVTADGPRGRGRRPPRRPRADAAARIRLRLRRRRHARVVKGTVADAAPRLRAARAATPSA